MLMRIVASATLALFVLVGIASCGSVSLLSPALADSDLTVDGQFHPNIDYASRAYHLLYGNPDSTLGPDPGWRDSVFDLRVNATSNTFQNSADGRFTTPRGITVVREVSCRMDMSTTIITSMVSYADSLKQSVEASASGSSRIFSASFSGSAEWSSAKQAMESSSSIMTKSFASCVSYSVQLWRNSLPPLSDGLVSTVKTLMRNGTSAVDAAVIIVNRFGTHVPLFLRMGSRFGTILSIASSVMSNTNSRELRVSAEAEASIGTVSGTASTTYDSSGTDATSISSSIQKTSTFSIGAFPPASGSAMDWMSQSASDPAVIYMRDLMPISKLLSSERFPPLTSAQVTWLNSLATAVDDRINALLVPIGASSAPSLSSLSGTVPQLCFGGVYQTGYAASSTQTASISDNVVNPFTSDLSCPLGFRSLPLLPSNGWQADGSAWLGARICVSTSAACALSFDWFSVEVPSMTSAVPETNCWPGAMTSMCACPPSFDTVTFHKMAAFGPSLALGSPARVFKMCTPSNWSLPVAGSFQSTTYPRSTPGLTVTRLPDTVMSSQCPPLYSPYAIGHATFPDMSAGCLLKHDAITYMCLNPLHVMLQAYSLPSASEVLVLPERTCSSSGSSPASPINLMLQDVQTGLCIKSTGKQVAFFLATCNSADQTFQFFIESGSSTVSGIQIKWAPQCVQTVGCNINILGGLFFGANIVPWDAGNGNNAVWRFETVPQQSPLGPTYYIRTPWARNSPNAIDTPLISPYLYLDRSVSPPSTKSSTTPTAWRLILV